MYNPSGSFDGSKYLGHDCEAGTGFEKVVIGNATLYRADCFEVMSTLGRVDAIVTDPPYGINANKMTLGKGKKEFDREGSWDDKAPEVAKLLGMADKVCIWGGNYFANQLPVNNDWLIWHKLNDGRSFSECELAWSNFGKQVRHISHHWGGEEKEHPTQKPLQVMRWCLMQIPDAGTIVDPFMGSGTTGVAAVEEGRKFIGIEYSRKYFAVAKRRIERAQQQQRLF